MMAEVIRNGEVHYVCDKCGEGEMISQSSALCVGSMRVLYYSVCNEVKCGYSHNMLRQYPQKIADVVFEVELERELKNG